MTTPADGKPPRPKIPLPDRKTPLDRRQTYGSVRGVTLVWHSGSWNLRLDIDGQRVRKSLGTSIDEEARRKLIITEGEVVRGLRRRELTVYAERPSTGGLRFREAAAQCFTEKRLTQGALERTLFGWERLLARYVDADLGGRYVTAIDRDDVKAVVLKCLSTQNRFGRANSKGTAGAVLGAIRIVFAWLIAEGKLRGRDGRDLANPASGLRELLRDRVGADDVRRRVRPFAPEEQERIVDFFRSGGAVAVAGDDFVVHDKARPALQRWWLFVQLAFRAGLRIGELIALELDDVDLEARALTVRRTWTPVLTRNAQGRAVPGIQTWPKGKRIRVVHLPTSVIEDLRAHVRARRAENLARRWTSPWLFVNTAGRVTQVSAFEQQMWLPALRALGLAGRRFHETRHTFGTELLYATKDFRYVSRMLGHSQQRTTQLYTHVMEELEQHQVDLVDEAARRRRPLRKAAARFGEATGRGSGPTAAGRRRHLRVVGEAAREAKRPTT